MKTSRFAQFAAERSKRTFVGELIKFVKGEFQAGLDRDLISPDRRFVAIMDTTTVGHLKWVKGEIVDSKMGLVATGFRPVRRDELGDSDSRTWEEDEDHNRRDPWQSTTLLVLASAAKPHELYTFSTNTVGGQGAVDALCAAHGPTTESVGQYPVVTLKGDSYQHKNRAYGRVKFPVLEVVDSVEAAPFNALVAEERGGAGFIPASVSPPALKSPEPPPAVSRSRPFITSGRQPPTPPTPPEPPVDDVPEPPMDDVPEPPMDDEAPPPIDHVPDGRDLSDDIPF